MTNPKQNKTKNKKMTPKRQNINQRNANYSSVSSMRISNIPTAKAVNMIKNGQIINGKRYVEITNQELLGTVSGSVAFNSVEYIFQPGLSIYPWLSQVAALYETYSVEELHYDFVPSVPTTVKGTIIYAFDYDATDPKPTTEQSIRSYHKCESANVFLPVSHKVDRNQIITMNGELYTRSSDQIGEDKKTFDAGKFIIATTDCTDTSVLGRIMVHYRLRFYKPQLKDTDGTTKFTGKLFSGNTAGQYKNPTLMTTLANKLTTMAVNAAGVVYPLVQQGLNRWIAYQSTYTNVGADRVTAADRVIDAYQYAGTPVINNYVTQERNTGQSSGLLNWATGTGIMNAADIMFITMNDTITPRWQNQYLASSDTELEATTLIRPKDEFLNSPITSLQLPYSYGDKTISQGICEAVSLIHNKGLMAPEWAEAYILNLNLKQQQINEKEKEKYEKEKSNKNLDIKTNLRVQNMYDTQSFDPKIIQEYMKSQK